jgi:hypothetical protein
MIPTVLTMTMVNLLLLVTHEQSKSVTVAKFTEVELAICIVRQDISSMSID